MKPKKPHPRKHHGRPDLRRMLATPPQGFYRLPEMELRGGSLLTDCVELKQILTAILKSAKRSV